MTNAASLIGIFVILRFAAPSIFSSCEKILQESLIQLSGLSEVNSETVSKLIGNFAGSIIYLCVPVAAAAAALSIVLTGTQTRFNFTMKQAMPKFSRINPLTGLKKMFTLRSLVELAKSILKILLIGWLVYTEVSSRLPKILTMTGFSVSQSIGWIGSTVFSIILKIAIVLAGIGAFDFFYQWWDYERQIKMTKQEIKDEYKQTEGDPKIKGRIRDLQRRFARMRMMQRVPTADVVVKNPTHYAVALKYEPKINRAPVVVAKGCDLVALKIIEIAEANGVEVTENRPLARGLYESVEIDEAIPEQFYQAVADVLAFVYNLKRKRKGK